MPMTRMLDVTAADRKGGMTLDEMDWLIKQAREAGATGSEVLEVTTVGWSHPRVKTAKVLIPADQQHKH